jgi:2'-5' RNA ligase
VTVRAFVALVPPAGALAELETAVAPVRAAHPGLRWTPPAQWHLTLAFLGEIDEGVLPELAERLARAARRHPPTPLALAGGGRFGDRVLWTRVHAAPGPAAPTGTADAPSVPGSPAPPGRVPHPGGPRGIDGVRRLAASVTAAARRSGIPVDDRPYRPHLTLARTRDGADLRPAVAALRGFTGSPWTADVVHLVRSRLGAGPGGTAAHDVVAAWPLGGAGRAR